MRRASHPRNALRENARFRRLTDRLHRLGARPTAEFVAELATAHRIPEAEILARLERYGRLPPEIVQAFGGDEWPTILPIAGGRR